MQLWQGNPASLLAKGCRDKAIRREAAREQKESSVAAILRMRALHHREDAGSASCAHLVFLNVHLVQKMGYAEKDIVE